MTDPPGNLVSTEPATAGNAAPSAAAHPSRHDGEPGSVSDGGKRKTAFLAIGLGILAVLWVVQNEVIHSSIQVGNAAPPIPALAALLLLAAATRIALRRQRRPAQLE